MNFKPTKEYVAKLLGREEIRFLIPEYQRPYRWEKDQCEKLWEDIIEIFNKGENIEEYFLGSIVAYENDEGKLEIIDGQQRLTTFTLLFRAFYECFETELRDEYQKDFGKCIWDYERNKDFLYDKTHLTSQVATESDVGILKEILSKTIDKATLSKKSSYAANYSFFYEKLREFKQEKSGSWLEFCAFILGNKLFVLLVVCDSQESAMTIFNTLNSRGLPLSNSDILKGYIYKYKKNHQQDTHSFTEDWRYLEELTEEYREIKSVDFFFLQYMHIIRAVNEYFDTTTLKMLDFFTQKSNVKCYGAKDNWLYKDETLPFIVNLANFWTNPKDFLSDSSLRYLNVLNLFQNASWKSFVSCLVWKNKAYFDNDDFDKTNFSKDFDKYLAELIKYMTLPFLNNQAVVGVTDEIVFKLNVNIFKGEALSQNFIQKYKFPEFEQFRSFCKDNPRKMKYLLYLYAFIYSGFNEDIIEAKSLQIEHILPQKWQYECAGWTEDLHKTYLEEIGNKILLDSKTNSKCSDNFFAYKQKFYKEKGAKSLKEIKDLGAREKHTWLKEDIESRTKEIYEKFKEFFTKKLITRDFLSL